MEPETNIIPKSGSATASVSRGRASIDIMVGEGHRSPAPGGVATIYAGNAVRKEVFAELEVAIPLVREVVLAKSDR